MIKTTNIDKYGKKRRGKSLITGDCIFPFKYKGKIHNICVNGKEGNWCATSINPKTLTFKNWGFCLENPKDGIPANPIGIDQLPRDAPLDQHIFASKVNDPDKVLRILNENQIYSLDNLLEISQEDILPELKSLGLMLLDRNRIKKYGGQYR